MSTPTSTTLGSALLDDGIASIRFFNGRLVTSGDMGREQEARRAADRRSGMVEGAGVVRGLRVQAGLGNTLTVDSGLAVASDGRVLRLGEGKTLELSPQQAATGTSGGVWTGFVPCGTGTSNAGIPADVEYAALVLSPAVVEVGKARVVALDASTVGCNTDTVVEAVQLRMLSVRLPQDNRFVPGSAGLRNLLAHLFLGSGAVPVPSSVDGRDPNLPANLAAPYIDGIGASDVPLALVHFDSKGQVDLVDNWALRRPLHRPESAGASTETAHPGTAAAAEWGGILGSGLGARGEAMLLQFQDHLTDWILSAPRPPRVPRPRDRSSFEEVLRQVRDSREKNLLHQDRVQAKARGEQIFDRAAGIEDRIARQEFDYEFMYANWVADVADLANSVFPILPPCGFVPDYEICRIFLTGSDADLQIPTIAPSVAARMVRDRLSKPSFTRDSLKSAPSSPTARAARLRIARVEGMEWLVFLLEEFGESDAREVSYDPSRLADARFEGYDAENPPRTVQEAIDVVVAASKVLSPVPRDAREVAFDRGGFSDDNYWLEYAGRDNVQEVVGFLHRELVYRWVMLERRISESESVSRQAANVAVDNSSGLLGENVQTALSNLANAKNSGFRFVLNQDNYQETLWRVRESQGPVQLFFDAGYYQMPFPLVLDGQGQWDLRIQGAGPATRLTCYNGPAVILRNWRSATLVDFSVEATEAVFSDEASRVSERERMLAEQEIRAKTKERLRAEFQATHGTAKDEMSIPDEPERYGGSLVVEGSEDVHLSRIHARSLSSRTSPRFGIAVYGRTIPEPRGIRPCRAWIGDCRVSMRAGHQGILAADLDEVEIRDCVVEMGPMSDEWVGHFFQRELRHVQRMVSTELAAYAFERVPRPIPSPTLAERRLAKESNPVIQEMRTRFARAVGRKATLQTVNPAYKPGWILWVQNEELRALSRKYVPAQATLPGALDKLDQFIWKALSQPDAFPAGSAPQLLGANGRSLLQQLVASFASRGIVVAGSRLASAHIAGNRISGAAEGLTVALSREERVSKGQRGISLQAGKVWIRDNRISVPDLAGWAGERGAVRIGGVERLEVTGNDLRADAQTWFEPIEGIRIWGSLGRLVRVEDNTADGFDVAFGLHTEIPRPGYPAGWTRWSVSRNICTMCLVVVCVPDKIAELVETEGNLL